jgi:hypothetical protein
VRIRTIKPEFWTSLTLSTLSFETRLTFIGLLNYCDDEGRGEADPRLIKAAIWPLDDAITVEYVGEMLMALALRDLVQLYEAGGRQYISVTHFGEHQSISKPRPSRLPDASGTLPVELLAGKERKGKERKEPLLKTSLSEFAEFWQIYPRRVGKRAALKAFVAALRRANSQTITEGAERYRDDPKRKPDFTAYPATWLNADRWTDESVVASAPEPEREIFVAHDPNPDELAAFAAEVEAHRWSKQAVAE